MSLRVKAIYEISIPTFRMSLCHNKFLSSNDLKEIIFEEYTNKLINHYKKYKDNFFVSKFPDFTISQIESKDVEEDLLREPSYPVIYIK